MQSGQESTALTPGGDSPLLRILSQLCPLGCHLDTSLEEDTSFEKIPL